MTEPLRGFDAFIYPVTLTATNKTIVLTEVGGATPAAGVSQALAEGKMYALIDSPPAGYTSFYAALETALNAASGNSSTYTVARANASLSSAFGKLAGISITVSGGGTTSFSLDFSDGSWTLPAKWLGFPADQSADESSTGVVLTSEMTVFGIWIPPERASDKGPKNPLRKQGKSRGKIASRRTNRLSSRDTRLFRYRYIAAGHLFGLRNQRAPYASTAGLAQDDDGNYFYDLWDLGFSADEPVFVIHDDGDTNTDITAPNGYEIIRIDEAEADKMDSLLANLRERRSGGEFYDVEFLAYLMASTYIHN